MAGFDLGGTAGQLVGGLTGGMGLDKGAWMGQSNYTAQPYQFDPNAFVDPNAAANRAQMLSGLNQANAYQPQQIGSQTVGAQTVGAQNVGAQGLDQGNMANQNALIQQLQQRMTGQGPSVAEQQLRQTTDTQNQAALSMAASAQGGINPALALRQAQDAQARSNQTAAGQAATLRATEQLGTTGALTSALGQQQSGQLTSAGLNLQGQTANQAAQLQAGGMNQAALLQAAGMNQAAALTAAQANQAAGLTSQGQKITAGVDYSNLLNSQSAQQVQQQMMEQQLKGQQALGTAGLNQNTGMYNAQQSGALGMGALGGIAGGIASKVGFAEGGEVQPPDDTAANVWRGALLSRYSDLSIPAMRGTGIKTHMADGGNVEADTSALVNKYLSMPPPGSNKTGQSNPGGYAGGQVGGLLAKMIPVGGASGPAVLGGGSDAALAAVAAATGGRITGPGGPKDDVVPVAASDGEYIVNAKAAAKYKPLLEKINKWGLKEQGREDDEVGGLLESLHARMTA